MNPGQPAAVPASQPALLLFRDVTKPGKREWFEPSFTYSFWAAPSLYPILKHQTGRLIEMFSGEHDKHAQTDTITESVAHLHDPCAWVIQPYLFVGEVRWMGINITLENPEAPFSQRYHSDVIVACTGQEVRAIIDAQFAARQFETIGGTRH